VTALLAGFGETRLLKPTLDLTEGLRLKPPQPLPRWFEPWEGVRLAAAQSGVQALPSDWQELLLRTDPGWQRQPRDTGRRTSYPHARRLPRMVASFLYSFTGCGVAWDAGLSSKRSARFLHNVNPDVVPRALAWPEGYGPGHPPRRPDRWRPAPPPRRVQRVRTS
jgi:hypothetical protein